jgi:DNA-directed RNA polymerase specialized sigma24 family protein
MTPKYVVNTNPIAFIMASKLRQRSNQVGPRIAAAEMEKLDVAAQDISCDPDIWLYRERTLALLRRYFRISIEVGRLPSLLGRELFRSRVTAYRMNSFEDAVIFVHDVEKSLEQLDEFERELIGKIVLQEYSHQEAARIMGCWRRTVGRRFPETLDRLSHIFLQGGLLARMPVARKKPSRSCQEAERNEMHVSGTI